MILLLFAAFCRLCKLVFGLRERHKHTKLGPNRRHVKKWNYLRNFCKRATITYAWVIMLSLKRNWVHLLSILCCAHMQVTACASLTRRSLLVHLWAYVGGWQALSFSQSFWRWCPRPLRPLTFHWRIVVWYVCVQTSGLVWVCLLFVSNYARMKVAECASSTPCWRLNIILFRLYYSVVVALMLSVFAMRL